MNSDQSEAGDDRCPACGEPGKKLDGDDWEDQNAYVCNENPCGVVMYGDGEMPGYGGI